MRWTGRCIAPGETFSFNGTVGPRTAEKGYQEAGAIVNGELVPQLGGGICQVGTTIFNTVFESGLPVVERHNHSFYISHYPKGRDATVSWGGPDFKFRNDTDQLGADRHRLLELVGDNQSVRDRSRIRRDLGRRLVDERQATSGQGGEGRHDARGLAGHRGCRCRRPHDHGDARREEGR